MKTQEALSRVNADFLEFVKKHPEALKLSSFKLLELNDWLFKLQAWPTFINQAARKNFEDAGVKLFTLIKQIPRRIFANDPHKIGEYLNLHPNAVQLQLEGADEEHLDYIMGRGDFILTDKGLKCLEYNVSPLLGGIWVPIWEKLYLNTPLIAQFLRENNIKIKNQNLLSSILQHAVSLPLKRLPGTGGSEINIAVAMDDFTRERNRPEPMEIYLNELYKDILHTVSGNGTLEGKVIFCDFTHLNDTGDYLSYKGKKIHAVIEMRHGIVPPKLIEALKSKKICLINGPVGSLLSNKLTLAALSEYRDSGIFDAEEKEVIDKYIPWTRKVIPCSTTYQQEKIADLERFILSNREKLVLKPPDQIGGEGICIGPKSRPEEWELAVKKAIKGKKWLVQKYVESVAGLYQAGEEGYDAHDMVWGFFVCGSRFIGAWNRVMLKKDNRGVINCHQGASVSILFEVDDQETARE